MTEPSATASTSSSAHAPAPANWHTLAHAPLPGTLLGHVDDVQDGQVLMREIFADADNAQQHPFKFLLLRSGTAIKAYANRCAHFGVPLAAKQEQLKFQPHTSISCNVHYARYRWSDGVCDKGECEGEALIAIPVQVDAQGLIHITEAT
jgi:nitrite reductase/ring-hydroxylating ferredoxin subunit